MIPRGRSRRWSRPAPPSAMRLRRRQMPLCYSTATICPNGRATRASRNGRCRMVTWKLRRIPAISTPRKNSATANCIWNGPNPPKLTAGASQDRGNSGVFLQGIYEVQILDYYDNPTYADGLCGGLYGQSPPLANACKKPGEWQTYDIIFEAARFGADHQLIRPASVTVMQNGVSAASQTSASWSDRLENSGQLQKRNAGPRPHRLAKPQGNPVRFRNIWIRNIAEEEQP